PPAPERISARLRHAPDPMRPAREVGADRYSARLLEAIDLALGMTREERPQSVAELRKVLREGSAAATTAVPIDRQAPVTPGTNDALRTHRDGAVARFMIELSHLPPPLTVLALILLGMLVNGASLLIGIGNFKYALTADSATLRKEVGFLSA